MSKFTSERREFSEVESEGRIISIGVAIGGLIFLAGCQSPAQEDPGLTAPEVVRDASSAVQELASGALEDGRGLISKELESIIVNVWSVSGRDCGLDDSPLPTEEHVFRGVPVELRAPAIHQVIVSVPLSAARVQRLLELLGATRDPRAERYLLDLWPRVEELVDRYHREVYEPLVASEAGDADFRVSDAYRATMIATVRTGALRGAIFIPTESALALLIEGLDDADPMVRAEAIIGLAARTDFGDVGRLRATRETLDGSWTGVDAALETRR